MTQQLAYPSVVELCLHANIIAFFLVLCAQDLELCRPEWAAMLLLARKYASKLHNVPVGVRSICKG